MVSATYTDMWDAMCDDKKNEVSRWRGAFHLVFSPPWRGAFHLVKTYCFSQMKRRFLGNSCSSSFFSSVARSFSFSQDALLQLDEEEVFRNETKLLFIQFFLLREEELFIQSKRTVSARCCMHPLPQSCEIGLMNILIAFSHCMIPGATPNFGSKISIFLGNLKINSKNIPVWICSQIKVRKSLQINLKTFTCRH